MAIDILFVFAIVMAVIKGYRTGLVVGALSFVAYYIGLAAALKLSAVVADHLSGGKEVHSPWLPVLSFLLVFAVVVLIVNIFSRLIRSFVSLTSMGWLDKVGGILFYIFIYIFIYSILIFYAVKISLLGTGTIASSKFYSFIESVAPRMMEFLGKILPFFADLFKELQGYFGNFT